MTANAVDHLCLAGGSILAERIGLHVLIEQLVGIELRAISRQLNQTQTLSRIGDEPPDGSGPMHGMAVDNQIDLVCGLFEHALEEFDERGVPELALEDHEVQCPAVGDGRDHVAAEALSRRAHHWRLPFECEARAADVITTQPHFVTPVDRRLLPLRLFRDLRIVFVQPARDARIVFLIGSPYRFLGTHAHAFRYRPIVHADTLMPYPRSMSCATDSRVHR